MGTDADEQQDADAVLAEAAASADEEALADAGLSREGGDAGVRRPARRASLAHRLYNGEAGLDVVGHSRLIYKTPRQWSCWCALLSIVFRGFDFGIDFEGGNSFRVPGSSEQLTDIRVAAENAGADVATAQVVGGNTVLLRTGQLDAAGESAVREAVAQAAGVTPQQVSPDAVSADWGGDVTNQALIALAVFLVAVVAFLAVRFEPKMAIAAIAALLHDIVVTAGVYSLIGFEVTPSTVIGFLTILGFSLYDTVVVFDKVDENTKDLDQGARIDLRRGRQPRGQPDPDAVDQHLGHRAAAGRRAAVRRRRPAGRRDAEGPRPGALRRPGRRHLLLDLPGHAGRWPTSRSASRSRSAAAHAGARPSVRRGAHGRRGRRRPVPAPPAPGARPRRAGRRSPSPSATLPRPGARRRRRSSRRRRSQPSRAPGATAAPRPGAAAAAARAKPGSGRPASAPVTGAAELPVDELIAEPRRRRPGLPRARGALPGPDAGLRRRPARSAGSSTGSPSPPTSDPRAAAPRAGRRRPGFDVVAGVEARGFLLAAAVALRRRHRASCRCARPASCPASGISADYDLEYGDGHAGAAHRLDPARAAGAGGRRRAGHRRHPAARRSRWSSGRRRGVRPSRWSSSWSALGGRQRIAPHAVHALWTI